MFTGLIQALGKIQHQGPEELVISCEPHSGSSILQGLELGDSIAVDGVCLTVARILPQGFIATASPETLHRTTLGHQTEQSAVNLEASLRVGSKLGGHFVTGHVDGTGYLEAAVPTASSWELSFTTEMAAIARYIVPKGSIAVNGISLTVADCDPSGHWFKVAVIPHTYQATNLQLLQPGSLVNLEGDILGKYAEKFLRLNTSAVLPGLWDNSADMPPPISAEGITPAFLAEHGYG